MSIFREIIPPALYQLYNKFKKDNHGWFGNITSWKEAKAKCRGYDAPEILSKVKESLLKVKEGKAVYERDSVLFDKIEYSWPLLAALLRIAIDTNNSLNIIDFGGSLGSTYFQCKNYLSVINSIKWNIVEQAEFVECGRTVFQNEELKFFKEIDTCIKEMGSNTLLVSSSIQYLEDPFAMVKKFIEFGFRNIIFDRTPFIEMPEHIITIQKVPPTIYEATYPAWFFNYKEFVHQFEKEYTLEAEFKSFVGDEYTVNGIKAGDKGFVLKKKGLK